jgi:hypothetical protein
VGAHRLDLKEHPVPPDLFSTGELVSYLQVDEFDTATALLARDLVTSEIRWVVGPAAYDAMTDVSAFKAIALAAAKRVVSNPAGLRSTARTIDDYSETDTYATETLGDAGLTDAERARIDRILGRSAGGAFTIRPVGAPDCWYVPLRLR